MFLFTALIEYSVSAVIEVIVRPLPGVTRLPNESTSSTRNMVLWH